MAPLVSILIVSYNTRDLTLACLRSVFAHLDGIAAEVVVFDNASSDGSAQAIREAFTEVRVIDSPENLGFAVANNRAALVTSGEFLLLLNPDTVVLDGAIRSLLAYAQTHPRAGIVGGRTRFANMSLNPTSCWRKPSLWSLACVAIGASRLFPFSAFWNPEAMPDWDRSSERRVDIVTGCFLLIRKSLWDTLGGFDESFFMYGEDADLCQRAWQQQKECWICPEAQIIHLGGRSEPSRAGKMVSLFRAKAQLIKKHVTPRQAAVAVRLLDAWALIRMLVFGVLQLAGRNRERYQTWRQIWQQRRCWHHLDFAGENVPAFHRKKVLAISSAGGHWTQLRRIAPGFEGHDVAYATVTDAYRAEVGSARYHVIVDATMHSKFRMILLATSVLLVLLRERPDVIVSTGAAPGFFALVLGKTLFRTRTVWLDSMANVEKMSSSGRWVMRFADLWLTQWPHLQTERGPVYKGAVL